MVGHASEKTDTFALGVVLLELLTGKPPYDKVEDEFLYNAMHTVLLQGPAAIAPLLDRRAPGVAPAQATAELASIAKQCLEMHVKQRCAVRDKLDQIDALAQREPLPRIGSSSMRSTKSGGGGSASSSRSSSNDPNLEQTSVSSSSSSSSSSISSNDPNLEQTSYSSAPTGLDMTSVSSPHPRFDAATGLLLGGGGGATTTENWTAPTPEAQRRSARWQLSSAQSAGMRRGGPGQLLGERLLVFDEVGGAEGRVGTVLRKQTSMGTSTKHVIAFDGIAEPEAVLLQKAKGAKGVRFRLLRVASEGYGYG